VKYSKALGKFKAHRMQQVVTITLLKKLNSIIVYYIMESFRVRKSKKALKTGF
jgi:hypothetical protein